MTTTISSDSRPRIDSRPQIHRPPSCNCSGCVPQPRSAVSRRNSHPQPGPSPRARLALLLLFTLTLPGCFGGGSQDEDVASSGSPEADRRAEQRAKPGSAKSGAKDRPLYERLGGETNIRALVDDFTARVIADPRVNFVRKDIRVHWYSAKTQPWHPTDPAIEEFKKHMTEFIALAGGGPSQYTGRDIKAVHEGMKITNTEFDAMIGDIKASMDKQSIPAREQRDLLAIIETTRKEIVAKP